MNFSWGDVAAIFGIFAIFGGLLTTIFQTKWGCAGAILT